MTKKHSKRFNLLKNLISTNMYSYEQGILLLKNLGTTKFFESLEAHISLNINPKYPNQQIRANLILPNGIGKNIKIAVYTEPENTNNILKMGASIVGFNELIDDIKLGKIYFDILLTTPKLMPQLIKLGKILGPKGLMPSPKAGTVTQNLEETINEFKKGKIEYRTDNTGVVHLIFGKTNFSHIQICENLLTIYESIIKNKPIGVKGRYIKSFYICNTMSPSLKLDLTSFK